MARAHLPLPCLALVTQYSLCPSDLFIERVAEAVSGGVRLVQLREKEMPAGQLLRLAEELRRAIAGRALLVVNDRLDVALAAGAEGVHLPEDGLPVAAARRVLGNDLLIGRSVHNLEAAVEAQAEGADYLFAGTIYPSVSHPGSTTSGPALLKQISAAVSIPVLGIGGITRDNVGEVMRAGASGAAVITAVLVALQPENAARQLHAAMSSKQVVQGDGR